MGPFQGPGEEKTVERLAADLPDDWEIIAGRKLPGKDRDDLDVVVIGHGLIFVLEEKSWGPAVHADDVIWSTTRREYRNPLDRIAYLSRVTASLLENRIDSYRQVTRGRHIVVPGVILSHDHLELTSGGGLDPREVILQLAGGQAVIELLDRDAVEPPIPVDIRDRVMKVLTGLASRDDGPLHIGEYVVEAKLSPNGKAERFLSQDPETGAEVTLQCFPLHGWGPGVDAAELFKREARALARLEELGRTWRADRSFVDEVHQLYVTPIRRQQGSRNLHVSARLSDPARPNGLLPREVILTVARDAFEGLAEIHGAGLVHRAIDPTRVFIGSRMKIRFTDFLTAKIDAAATVGPWLLDISDPVSPLYRAPECREDPRFASTASDVFSLALSLAIWITNSDTSSPSIDVLHSAKGELEGIGELLDRCLSKDPAERPSAQEMAESLRALEASEEQARAAVSLTEGHRNVDLEPVTPPASAWGEGTEVNNRRYVIKRKLGEGGLAVSWLVRDQLQNAERVIKQFKDVANWRAAFDEFQMSSMIVHERCARVWDVSEPDSPVPYIVNSFVEGDDLEIYMGNQADVSAETSRQIAIDILEALDYLHRHLLLHRDVTPGNIIIDYEGRATLIDFGLTNNMSERQLGWTPEFVAPEVRAGANPTVRSDLYGLGLSMLTTMLGRRLYPLLPDGSQSAELALPTDAERRLWGPLGASLLTCFIQSAAFDPLERPSSAEELRDNLINAIETQEPEGERVVNPTVNEIRALYKGSVLGNAGNRGLDDTFARETYVSTQLDELMTERVISAEFDLVVLTGNPGDGKTSFLKTIRDELIDSRGGQVIREDAAGWLATLGLDSFAAVYDASESNGFLTSDELLHQALGITAAGPTGRHVTLIAANDGRLLQFFTDHADRYETFEREVTRQLRRGGEPANRVAVIDLKRRSLVGYRPEESVGLRVLDQLISEERWAICGSCLSREVCPILWNVKALRLEARSALHELLSTSHFRRLRRATFRDLRSVLSWLITADRSCEFVHGERERGIDTSKADGALIYDLAFDSTAADFLLHEWADLDPSALPSPEIERKARAEAIAAGVPLDRARLRSLQRRVFFGLDPMSAELKGSVRAYRYYEEFVQSLSGGDDGLRQKVLLGMSRILGAPGYSGKGLALASNDPASTWAVMKVIDEQTFRIEANAVDSTLVEAIPDRLTLFHDVAGSFSLTLDTFELVMRAANGEIPNDQYADALKQEIEGFGAQLQSQPADVVHIVDPFGRAVSARRSGTVIELERL